MFSEYRQGNKMFGKWELTAMGCDLFERPTEELIQDWEDNVGKLYEKRENKPLSTEQYAISLFELGLMRIWQGDYFDQFLSRRYPTLTKEEIDSMFDLLYNAASREFVSEYFLDRDIDNILYSLGRKRMGGQQTLICCIEDWFINNKTNGNVK